MAEEFTVTLSVSNVEDLRCSICPGYLSCSPVRLLPNGNCICGACSPLNTDAPIHHLVSLEALLSQTSFPCVFKKYGCTEMLLFGGTVDHESTCAYKPFACPTSTSTTCPWEGSVSQLLRHFQNNHPDFLKEKAEFNLELGKDKQDVFMTTINSFLFILKYFYNADQRILKYDIRLCANKNNFKVIARIRLSSGADADFNTNLKIKECSSYYDETFYDMQNAKELNVNKFLESLGGPDSLVVALKRVRVVKPNSNDKALINISAGDIHVIKALRCDICDNYLVPPIFDFDGKTICCDCGEKKFNCKPSTDTDLLERVNEAVYPCRWRECTFLSKSNLFKDHAKWCQFRQFYCVYGSCNTFRLSEVAAHVQAHLVNRPIVFIPGKITFKTSFAKSYTQKQILTIKNNIVVLVEHKMINLLPPYQFSIIITQSRDGPFNIGGIVEFEHEHCTIKSKEFKVGAGMGFYLSSLSVVLKDLPPCFTDADKLTVNVKVTAS